MSIDTELARLTNAKAAIKAAIEGKGVTVPDGTLLDGMASLIGGIEAGGGDPFGSELFAIGTYTPASDIAFTSESSAITIEFGFENMGGTHILSSFIFFRIGLTKAQWGETLLLSALRDANHLGAKNIGGRSNLGSNAATGNIKIVSSSYKQCTFYSGISSSTLKAASTYGWIAKIV